MLKTLGNVGCTPGTGISNSSFHSHFHPYFTVWSVSDFQREFWQLVNFLGSQCEKVNLLFM